MAKKVVLSRLPLRELVNRVVEKARAVVREYETLLSFLEKWAPDPRKGSSVTERFSLAICNEDSVDRVREWAALVRAVEHHAINLDQAEALRCHRGLSTMLTCAGRVRRGFGLPASSVPGTTSLSEPSTN